MEEKFVLLNLKLTTIYDYTVALEYALDALVNKPEYPTKQYSKLKDLQAYLYEAGVMAI